MLQMPCQVILRILLDRQLHTDLRLPLTMYFSPMLEVGALLKHKVQAMTEE